ncbi:MAG: fibronectin type III domain-containing protein, partial [bacterium]|nr:fibronectin type III domain-containing protein [bacterium]
TIIAQFTKIPSPISEVTVSAVTESEADIEWTTSPEGYSQIEYGTTENYGSVSNRSEGGKGHSYKLRKLEPKTLYHFRILFVSKDGAEFLSNDYVFTTRSIEELVSAVLYPVRTVSSRGIITHFGSTLFNDSSQTITVYKMEILDESSNVAYLISHYESEGTTIAETWGNGEIPPRKSISMVGWVNPPFKNEDIVEWRVEWYCEAANGERFTITGKFSSFVDFFNWLTK